MLRKLNLLRNKKFSFRPKFYSQESSNSQNSTNSATSHLVKRVFAPKNWIFPLILIGGVYYITQNNDLRAKKRESQVQSSTQVRNVTAGKPMIGGPFTLVNASTGLPITDSEFRGKWMMMYFGFCNCPDICPEEMSKMTKALNIIEQNNPEIASQIQPIFISVDPHRDSCANIVECLKGKYFEQITIDYHPRFVGLTGTQEQIKAACKKYRVFYSAPEYEEGKDYLVDHSIFIYLMDKQGTFCEYFAKHTTAEQVADLISKRVK